MTMQKVADTAMNGAVKRQGVCSATVGKKHDECSPPHKTRRRGAKRTLTPVRMEVSYDAVWMLRS
jgi:hypothetical protein